MNPPPSFPLHSYRLANGLVVNVLPDPRLPLVAVNVWYHVGSRNERPSRTGLAHLFEHMLFQGSAHVGANEHFRYVQQAGGTANGSTWFDRTNYYETLPAHQLGLGLWLESDRMGFFLPALDREKLETQRSVVMNERRQRVDNQPYGRPTERVHELLYPADHPYHWPVIGYLDDIASATFEDVRDFYAAHYGPENAVLTLAGDLAPEPTRDLVERYFGELPPGNPEAERGARALDACGLPPALGRRREVLPVPARLTRLGLAWAVPSFGTEAWYAAMVLAELLAGGKSSRLPALLVLDRQLAQTVACGVMPLELCATWPFSATLRPEARAEEVEDLVFAEVGRVARREVDGAELDGAKRRLLSGHYFSLQSLEQRADSVSRAATFLSEPQRAFEAGERLAAVTADHLAALAEC